jgi:hypothetical protein
MKRLSVNVVVLFAGLFFVGLPAQAQDDRGNFEATFYTGASIDSFAAQDLNKYLNPGDSSTKKLGYIAGVDFGYRALGKNESGPQLWLYGQTVHGQRSAEVDCSGAKESQPDACGLGDFLPRPGAFLSILRNASSLEAFGGARLELLTLRPESDNASKLYVKSELGFFTISGAGGDVFDSHQKAAVGLAFSNGLFRNSYLETGWGKSDVFTFHPGRRFKLDGYLEWDFLGENSTLARHGMRPFIEITLDSDFGKGADSVRTFYGFNFDLDKLMNPAKKEIEEAAAAAAKAAAGNPTK